MLGLMTTEDGILLTGEFTTPLFVRLDNFEFARWSNCDRTMREPHQPDDGRAGGSPKHEFTTTGHVRSTVLWSLSHTLAQRRDCHAVKKSDELTPSHRGFLKCATFGVKVITSKHRLFRARLSARGHEPLSAVRPSRGVHAHCKGGGDITPLSKARQCFLHCESLEAAMSQVGHFQTRGGAS